MGIVECLGGVWGGDEGDASLTKTVQDDNAPSPQQPALLLLTAL